VQKRFGRTDRAIRGVTKARVHGGFRYRDDLGNTMKPEFFKGFPATAVFEPNLVWDTRMLEMFGQHLQLKTGIGELCQT
jgi:hypothetical protein